MRRTPGARGFMVHRCAGRGRSGFPIAPVFCSVSSLLSSPLLPFPFEGERAQTHEDSPPPCLGRTPPRPGSVLRRDHTQGSRRFRLCL